MSNQFQIHKKVRDAVILNLRRIFTGDPDYPYVETPGGEYDFDNTKIIISDAIPVNPAFYPAIVVDATFGNETRYLGPDSLGELRDSGGNTTEDRLFSSLVLTVNLNIFTAQDTIARDEILDRIYDHLKLITDDLAESGVEVQSVSFSPESRIFQEDRWWVTARISLQVYTEWEDDLGPGDLISSIPVEITLDLG